MTDIYRSIALPPLEIIKLPPLVLYEISQDIQITEKWKEFAMHIGFSSDNIIMIEMHRGDRFPAENVMYHWCSKNPNVEDLAKVLCRLNLERSLHRLRKYVTTDKFAKFEKILQEHRNTYIDPDINTKFCEFDVSELPQNDKYQSQLSNTSSNTSTTTALEPGMVNFEAHRPHIERSISHDVPSKESNEGRVHESVRPNSDISIFETILTKKSTCFDINELMTENFDRRHLEGKFCQFFCTKLRGNRFQVQSISLKKLSESRKNQKKLYNTIWSLLNFRLPSLPLLIGYCFSDEYLFIIYPFLETKPLFDILHRNHNNDQKVMPLTERLMIMQTVGEALSFLHCSIPFGACHGCINSHNVQVGTNITILSGFDRFYTEDADYLKGLNTFSNPEIKIEEYYGRDILNYLELLCEIWWNIQPYKINADDDESLLEDIKNTNSLPKVQFAGWREDIHDDIRRIVINYGSPGKKIVKIEEIVDDLNSLDISSGPPSYKEIEDLYHFKN